MIEQPLEVEFAAPVASSDLRDRALHLFELNSLVVWSGTTHT